MALHILSCCMKARLPLECDKKPAHKDGPSVAEAALVLMLTWTSGEHQSHAGANHPFQHHFGRKLSKHAVQTSKCYYVAGCVFFFFWCKGIRGGR